MSLGHWPFLIIIMTSGIVVKRVRLTSSLHLLYPLLSYSLHNLHFLSMLWILISSPKTKFTIFRKKILKGEEEKSHCCPSQKWVRWKGPWLVFSHVKRKPKLASGMKSILLLFFRDSTSQILLSTTSPAFYSIRFFLTLISSSTTRYVWTGWDKDCCLEPRVTKRRIRLLTPTSWMKKTFCAPNHEGSDLNPLDHKSCPSLSLLPFHPFSFYMLDHYYIQ